MSERLAVEVLGPLRVLDAEGRDVTPDGALQRRLLALFVLRAGHVVTAERAVDALWPTARPREPIGALQNHLSRLRRALPAGLIETVGDGYRVDPASIDVDRDRLHAAIHGDAPDPALDGFLDALLARWHGPAFPELADLDDGRVEAARLDELRVRAREVRAERRLARGDTDGLVAELAALATEEPLREHPRALLMAALAATGRTAEALRVYDDFRRLLGDELGVEPSPALAARHAALLAGDAPAPSAAPPAPPPRALDLPVPATSLVGRDELAAGVATQARTHRVLTLVGPGGVGKTRLLIEVGHRVRAADPHRRVVLAELASADRDAATGVVADALGIDARPGRPLDERIASVVGADEVVLLLDNCEHVLDPVAALVERLLAYCPGVTVVASSRERLRVPGEVLCPVPPLPSAGDGSPARELFLDRAAAARPGFDPGEHDLARVDEIVRRLDGLPLAIELAAARLHTHDLVEVAAALDRRFSLLTAGRRAEPRHASLAAAVAWSFELLDPSLQEIFVALSAFAGSFDAAGAAAVCGTDPETAAGALSLLVERSLVTRTADRRYLLLETLRAFGADRLAEAGQADAVRSRHARHVVEWIEYADRRLAEPGGATIADIDAMLPELRAAHGWLLGHDYAELAGRLVRGLLHYGFLRLRPDVLAWAEAVARADPDDRSPHAPHVWVALAYTAWMAGDMAGIRAAVERAHAVAQRAGGELPADVASMLGNRALFEGDLDAAAEWYRRAVAAATDNRGLRLMCAGSEVLALGYAGDPSAGAKAAALLDAVGDEDTAYAAYVWYCAGEADLAVDVARARSRLTRAVEIAGRNDAASVTGIAGASRASVDARFGDPAAAARDYRELVDHWRRAGMWPTQWTMLRSIAGLLARLGKPRDAAVLVGAVRATDAGHRIFGADERTLDELADQLRGTLGPQAYDDAVAAGAVLDGDAAVEHALGAL